MGERIERLRGIHSELSEMLKDSPAEGQGDYGKWDDMVYMNMAYLKRSIEDLFCSIQEPIEKIQNS